MAELLTTELPSPDRGKSIDAAADTHLRNLLVTEVEEPWIHGFIRNIKETFNPPKLPPLEVTSKPVAVKDIWGLYGRKKESWMMSFGFQAAVVTLLFTVFSARAVQEKIKDIVHLTEPPIDIAPYQPKMAPKKQAM